MVNHKSDDDLRSVVNRIRDGDEKAFDTLFLMYYSALCRFAWRYVKSEAIAEELVQELFTYLWENRIGWEPRTAGGTIRGYLYKSIKHRAIDHLKHQEVIDRYAEVWEPAEKYATIDIEDDLREEKLKKAIGRAIENLPEHGKMVFKLHRYDGLTYKEIAQVMDISVKTVENHMGRVFKILRQELSHFFPILLALLGKVFMH